jgi:hypothetical protein
MIIFCIVMVNGCTQEKAVTKNLTSDKFVLIEFSDYRSGIVVDSDFRPQLISWGGYPPALIEANKNEFESYEKVNETGMLAVLAYSNGEKLPDSSGSEGRTFGIYGFPFNYDGVTILNINDDGVATIACNNNTISLKSGEKWLNSTSHIELKDQGNISYKVDVTQNYTIINYGIWNKSGIKSGKLLQTC